MCHPAEISLASAEWSWAGLGWAELGWAVLGWLGLAGLGWAWLGWAGLVSSFILKFRSSELTRYNKLVGGATLQSVRWGMRGGLFIVTKLTLEH